MGIEKCKEYCERTKQELAHSKIIPEKKGSFYQIDRAIHEIKVILTLKPNRQLVLLYILIFTHFIAFSTFIRSYLAE